MSPSSDPAVAGPELVLELAQRLREVVLPELGSHAGRAEAGDGAGGDVTFAVDELAESARAALERDGRTILSYGPGGGYGPLPVRGG